MLKFSYYCNEKFFFKLKNRFGYKEYFADFNFCKSNMHDNKISEWKWGILAAAAVTILMLLPQISLWFSGNWQGSYVLLVPDEVAYSAYVNALIDGRERRNDPYTGRDDRETAPQAESLFSIQFVPAYLIALPARILNLSASAAFVWLLAISSFLSTLAIFWLIKSITGDARLAAAGAISILCFGALIATYGEIRTYFADYLGQGAGVIAIPFTRRYQPSAAFPLLFVFFGFVWHALTGERRRTAIISSIAAGLSLAILIFSYFYLWTAAVAWLAGTALLYLIFQRHRLKYNLTVFLTIGFFAVAAIIPYLMLLSRRLATLDNTQALTASHLPDLIRLGEWIAVLLLIILIYAIRRGIFELKDHFTLFALSFALLPLIVFNQQIITGVSLQPIHYELYIANYVVLVALVLTIALFKRNWVKREFSSKMLMLAAVVALGWGFIEVSGVIKRDASYTKQRDGGMPVLSRLKELSKTDGTFDPSGAISQTCPVMLASDFDLSEAAPTVAPQAVLWSLHMPVFSGLKTGENKERLYEYLYYTNINEQDLTQALLSKRPEIIAAFFGYERALPALTANPDPISNEEVRAEMNKFIEFKAKFSSEQAARHNLSYVIVYAEDDAKNLINIDRWYERDAGEQLGKWKLYRVKLRP